MNYRILLLSFLTFNLAHAIEYRVQRADFIDGGASASRNYIKQSEMETGIQGWVAFNDGVGPAVDCTGGVVLNTVQQSLNGNLRGAAELQYDLNTSNQGEGFAYEFTIDPADEEEDMLISFDYLLETPTEDQLKVRLYDVDNASFISTSEDSFPSTSGEFKASFQTSDSSNYRLCVWRYSGAALAQDENYFDSVKVERNDGEVIETTTPKAYTPTFTGFGTTTNVNFISWREGAFLMVKGFFTAGTPTATEARITLGYDGTDGNVTSSSNISGVAPEQCGDGRVSQTLSTTDFAGRPVLCEGSKNYMTFTAEYSTFGTGLAKANGNGLLIAGATYSFMAKVQIEGWGGTNVWKPGFPGQEWTDFTPTSTITTTNVTHSGNYQCVAGNLSVMGLMDFSGTNTDGTFVVSLPSGYEIDTGVTGTNNTRAFMSKIRFTDDSAGTGYVGEARYSNSTQVAFMVYRDSTASSTNDITVRTATSASNVPFTIANGDKIRYAFTVPVTADSPCPRAAMPLMKHAVTTSSESVERIERASVTCSSSSTITRQSGNWIDSIANISSGSCTLTLKTGYFSAIPTCTASLNGANSAITYGAQVQGISTTSVKVTGVYNTGGATTSDTGAALNILCMGPN